MHLPALGSSPNVFRANHTGRTSSTADAAATPGTGTRPDVTISAAGRKAAYAEQATASAPNAQSSTSGTPALEMYQVPKWLADYGFEVPNKLGASANWFAEKYPKAAAAPQAALAEYGNRLEGHFRSVLDANGIKELDDFHDALIVDQGKSEPIRQQLAERLRADPRMVELMQEVGKSP